jgi:GntR family transcriptional regulator
VGEVADRIEQSILQSMLSGDLGPGAKLPSERQLAAEHAASRTTVRFVLVKLSAQGLIEPQHGRGYFVRASPAAVKRAQKASERK